MLERLLIHVTEPSHGEGVFVQLMSTDLPAIHATFAAHEVVVYDHRPKPTAKPKKEPSHHAP